MSPRRAFFRLNAVFLLGVWSLQGCRSLALRYSMSATDDWRTPSEMDQLLAQAIEKRSPTFLDRPLKALVVVAPDYPDWISRRHTGSVLVSFTIGPQGTVTPVTPMADDNPELVKLVNEALVTWRFDPPMRNGQPTSVTMKVPFIFQRRGNGR